MDDKAAAVAELTADAGPFNPEADKARKAMAVELLGNLIGDGVETLRRRANGVDKPIPLPGWGRLADALGGGLWPGCHVLTGGTGTGKSQFALQLAYQAARDGIPTRYVALELDALGLVARLLCMAEAANGVPGANVPWWSTLYTGREGAGAVIDRLSRTHAPGLAELPLYLATDQGPDGWPYTGIGPAVEQLRAAHPEAKGRPVLLVVDFLQLLSSPDGAREELRERIGRAAYQARQAARKHGAAVLLLSATARDNYKHLDLKLSDGEPEKPAKALVGLGKESGEIEYAADTALALGRTADAGDRADPGAVWLAVAKQRAGRSGWFRLVEQSGWFVEGEARGPAGAATGWPDDGLRPVESKPSRRRGRR